MVDSIKGLGKRIVIKKKTEIKTIIKKAVHIKQGKKEVIIEKTKELLVYGKEIAHQLETVVSMLPPKTQKLFDTIEYFLDQQEEHLADVTQSIKDRIISLHDPLLRPIHRGKKGAPTEFGMKVGLIHIGQKLLLSTHQEYNNFSDTSIVEDQVNAYEKVFKRKPDEYSADKGLHSPESHRYLKDAGITDGIAYRGRIPKDTIRPPQKTQRRMFKQRIPIEGSIGLLKRRYGGSKVNYKSENMHVRLSFAIMCHNIAII